MKTICIYHGNCLDGFTAAWVVNKAIEDVTFIAGSYTEEIDVEQLKDAHVIFVDFSVKREKMIEIIEAAQLTTVLDHHASADKELDGLHEQYQSAVIVFDMNRSGAMLAWNYYYPEEPAPELVKHVQDRDLWRFELEHTKAIAAYMFSLDQTFENWDMLEDTLTLDLAHYGNILETKFNKDVDSLIESCARFVEFDGHYVMAANVPYLFASEVGNRLVADHEFSITYFQMKNGDYKYSLRAKDEFDVSVLAEKYGGGGHPNAAGFSTPEQVWKEIDITLGKK